MKIKIIQNQIGNFFLYSKEKQLVFSIGLFEDGKIISNGDLKAKISFWLYENLERERDWLYEYFQDFNLEEILQKNKEYLENKFLVEEGKNNTNFFIEKFLENKDLILENFKKEKIESLKKEIEKTENIFIENEDIEYFKFNK